MREILANGPDHGAAGASCKVSSYDYSVLNISTTALQRFPRQMLNIASSVTIIGDIIGSEMQKDQVSRTMRKLLRKVHPDYSAVQLLLRGAIGGTMVAHGVKHAQSIDGTAGWFESIGFRQPRIQAQVSAVVEIGAGAAIVAGAATPLASAAVVGTMAVAARSVHLPNGFFITSEGWEYVANLSVAAVALAALGPGPYSIDRALALDAKLTPHQAATLSAVIGLTAAGVQLASFFRPERSS